MGLPGHVNFISGYCLSGMLGEISTDFHNIRRAESLHLFYVKQLIYFGTTAWTLRKFSSMLLHTIFTDYTLRNLVIPNEEGRYCRLVEKLINTLIVHCFAPMYKG